METNERLDIARRIVEHTGSSVLDTVSAATGRSSVVRHLGHSTGDGILGLVQT